MGSAGGGRTSSDSHRRSCDVNRDECPEPEVCTCCAARAVANFGFKRGTRSIELLEPISKSPEEDNEASELYEAEEVLGVVFPTDEDAALPLNPSKEALHEPASHIAA